MAIAFVADRGGAAIGRMKGTGPEAVADDRAGEAVVVAGLVAGFSSRGACGLVRTGGWGDRAPAGDVESSDAGRGAVGMTRGGFFVVGFAAVRFVVVFAAAGLAGGEATGPLLGTVGAANI